MSLARLLQWMQQHEVEAACITRPVSVGYLTGFHTDPHERLMALVAESGAVTLLVPELERENAEAHAKAPGLEVVSWRDGDDQAGALAALIPEATRVGVEMAYMNLLL